MQIRKQLTLLISSLFPNKFADIALSKLGNPQIVKLRQNEEITLNKATQNNIPFKGFSLKTYHWKGNGDTILLIHGWEGQAGNFSDLIEKLITLDFNIYAFDAPAHGYSSKGETSISDFTESVGLMIEKSNAKKLISHSFGGVATTYALFKNQHLHIDKYALLTTPDKFTERIDDVIQQVGIANNVKEILISKLKETVGTDLDMLSVSEFVKNINVAKALIIHDKNDKLIPIERSLNVHHNWNESEFITIEGTGHFRILRTESVINQVVDFLN